jgi:hypothetical protein
VTVDRDEIRGQLRSGRTPEQVGGGDRTTHRIALEEDARLAGELGAFPPTPESAVHLRDERLLRWEAIAARIYGQAGRIASVQRLYDELKGAVRPGVPIPAGAVASPR